MNKSKTTARLHAALDPNGKLQPILNASISLGDILP